MRVCFVLLAAAATLLASSDTVAAKTTSELSKLAAADAVQPVDAAMTTNRFLRSYQDLDEEADDDDEAEEEAAEEERARPLFDTKKLNKALNSHDYSQKLFKRWKNNDYTDAQAAAKMGVDVDGGFGQTYSSLYTAYRAYLRSN